MTELEQNKHLEEFKKAKRQPVKRTRAEEDDTLPEGWKTTAPNKKLRRMHPEDEFMEMTEWWEMAEGRCLTVGTLRRRLDRDTARVLRRMELMDIDRILSDSQDWWKIALAWVENRPQSPKTINAREFPGRTRT